MYFSVQIAYKITTTPANEIAYVTWQEAQWGLQLLYFILTMK